MRKFEYDIKFDEDGIPFIILPNDYIENVEDKFMIIHLTRNILESTYDNIKENIPSDDLGKIITLLDGISFEVGLILGNEKKLTKDYLKIINSVKDTPPKKFDMVVDNIKERNKIPQHNIIYGDEIFERKKGFRVYVENTKKIYELTDGTTNKHWRVCKKL